MKIKITEIFHTQTSRKRTGVITQQNPIPYNKCGKNDIPYSPSPYYNKGGGKINTETEKQQQNLQQKQHNYNNIINKQQSLAAIR